MALPWNLDHEPTPPNIVTSFKCLTRGHPNPNLNASFQYLDRLPAELQVEIVKHCDRATSWQLMRTSSALREMVGDAFWNDEQIYYSIRGSWLWRSRQKGYKNIVDYQGEFWSHVRNILLDAERFEWIFEEGKEWRAGPHSVDERMNWFWSRVQQSFPAARKILLDNYLLRQPPPRDGEVETGPWAILRRVLDTAPKHIEVRMLINGAHYRYSQTSVTEHSLVGSNQWGGWKIQLMETWKPDKIVSAPGVWTLPDGIVKQYERMKHLKMLHCQAAQDYNALLLQAWAIRGEAAGIQCPFEVRTFHPSQGPHAKQDCDFTAHESSEWRQHFSHRHSVVVLPWPSGLSEDATSSLDMRMGRANHLKSEYQKAWHSLKQRINGGYAASSDFSKELETEVKQCFFPDCERRANEVCYINEYIHGEFWSFFDPTHVYFEGYHENQEYNDDIEEDLIEYTESEDEEDDSDRAPGLTDIEIRRRERERLDAFWEQAGFVSIKR